MKKYIGIGVGVIVVGVIGMIVLAVLNLGTLIKTATETIGPKITKTEVLLNSADISILSGSGTLEGFLLGNPKGFKLPSAVECKTIRIKVVKESLTSNKIIIDEVFLDGPVISYEKRGGTDNFKTILNNINKTVASEKKQQTAESSDTGAEKKIQINNFIVKNGRLNLSGSLLDAFGDQGTGINLPDIHLKDIGKEKDTTPAEAFAMVLKELTGNVTGTISDVGKKLKEQMGKAVEGVSKGVGKAVEDATKGTGAIGDAVKGLLNSQ